MADPFTIACGAAQFVGLAGQIIEGISVVRRKFNNIKGAPKLIHRLHQEIACLEVAFKEIDSVEHYVPEHARPALVDLMHQSFEPIEDVFGILIHIPRFEETRGMKRFWKGFLADQKRPKLEEALQQLERHKNTITTFLTGLNLQMTSTIKDHLAAHTAIVEPSLQRIEAGISGLEAKSDNIYSQTIEIQQDIAESSAAVMKHMDNITQQVIENLPRLVQLGLRECIEGTTKDLVLQSENRHQPPQILEPGMRFSEIASEKSNSDRTVDRYAFKGKTFSKTIPLPIGFIQTKSVRSMGENGTELLQFQISLVPFRWLSSHGKIITVDKISQTYGTSWKFTLHSYNVVPSHATIIQACRNRDLEFIQKLFQYGEASPFDVDSEGKMLMSHVWNSGDLHEYSEVVAQSMREAQKVVQFLIDQGADPTSYIRVLLKAYHEWTRSFYDLHLHPLDDEMIDPSVKRVTDIMEGFLRLCLRHSTTDPFSDTETLLMLWKSSLGGESFPPLDSSWLFQEDLLGLDYLVYEMPDQVFHDVLCKRQYSKCVDEAWQELADGNYETLVYLCRGGANSIKSKVFSPEFAKTAPRLDAGKTCYCPENSNHLLFQALYGSYQLSMPRGTAVRRHIKRLLTELLAGGEDPEARCACNAKWQSPGGYRSVTDLAGEEGLLREWEKALIENGHDATRIIDQWRYEGIPDLFEAPKTEKIQKSERMASLKAVGTVFYTTISFIV